MGGVSRVVLTSAVGVGAGPLGHAEDQLALAGFAGGQFGDGELTSSDAGVEFGACHVSEVVTWPVYTKRGGGQRALHFIAQKLASRIEEKNGTVVIPSAVFIETNQSKIFLEYTIANISVLRENSIET